MAEQGHRDAHPPAPRLWQRPVADIDVLILGSPDRDQLYEALSAAETRLGRPVQATIREAGWLNSGSGSFYETMIGRPMLKLTVGGPQYVPVLGGPLA
jgi:hypothetical protein